MDKRELDKAGEWVSPVISAIAALVAGWFGFWRRRNSDRHRADIGQEKANIGLEGLRTENLMYVIEWQKQEILKLEQKYDALLKRTAENGERDRKS